MKILIAEDNNYTQIQYKIMLEKHGHEVIITKNGNECINMFNKSIANNNSPFDVIILDNNMPQKTGVEVAQEILDKIPTQRILFVSAYDINSVPKATKQVKETVEILQKPFPLISIVNKLENKL